MSTPHCALSCPSCGTPIPVGVLYGPCAKCRAELNARAESTFAGKLEDVADALAEGWSCDDARRCWARIEPCGPCDGIGETAGVRCRDCKGTGSVEVIREWVA